MSPPSEESQNSAPKDECAAKPRSRLAAMFAWAWGKFDRREPGVVVSAGAHVALLAATLIAFADTSKFEEVPEGMPVEVISDAQFSQITKGEKTAKQVQPKPKAEKVADLTETKPTPPIAEAKRDVPTPPPPLKRLPDPGEDEKPDVKPEPPTPPQRVAALPPKPEPPPRPEPKVAKPEPPKAEKPPEPEEEKEAEIIKPQPPPRPKIAETPTPPTPPKPVEKPKEPTPPKLDQVAKFLEQKKLEEKPVRKSKSGEENDEPKHKLDVTTISQLLSKEAPQARASTARELTRTAALGAPNASAAQMAPSMWDSLDSLMREQYKKCWSYIGLNAQKYVAQIRVRYAQDGSLQAEPILVNPPSDPNIR
ncbi:MAG: cell envelope biogenesis protein TolA, partial [Methylobacteriaceae bacterium]|nr:cell envelope biogenesis protein TolA [Methylobacteriaceae bacterium]